MFEEKIVKLGDHLPLSTRRVVSYFGQPASYKTPVGLIEALADGAVLVRDNKGGHIELSPKEARQLGEAFSRAAFAIEQWQRHASGYDRVLATRSATGEVFVTYQGRTRPMRLSVLRGRKDREGKTYYRRACTHCDERPPTLCADDDT